MSSTLRATTSQPRSLLSIARLNIARSRLRSATWSLVRIDQTCFGRSGGLAPTSLPLFQGPRLSEAATEASLSCMVILLVGENGQHAPTHALRSRVGVRLQSRTCRRRASRSVAESDPKQPFGDAPSSKYEGHNFWLFPPVTLTLNEWSLPSRARI